MFFIFTGCSSVVPLRTSNGIPSQLETTKKQRLEIKENNKIEVIQIRTVVDVIEDYEVQTVKHVQSSTQKNKQVKKRQAQSDPTVDLKSDLHLTYIPKLYNFWIKYFSKREKKRFLRHMRNGEKYRSLIQKVFRKHGLPEDLYYVGLIESGYNTRIRSHAGAVGPWQFIKGTATRYGMKVNSRLDERRNIHKATESAASYFKDLYNIFGSWELALCAYNAGEYRIIGAIRRGNTRDYIQLVRKKLLPKETIYYVPKVVAARELAKNSKKYGINVKRSSGAFYTNSDLYKMTKSFDLKSISKKLGMSYQTLRKLNPDVKYRSVRATKRRPVRIVVPKKKIRTLAKIYPTLKSRYVKRARTISNTRRTSSYRVRNGDNLYRIASKFKTTVSQLKMLNPKLKKRGLWAREKIRIPSIQTRIYTVKRGDNLTKIARRFGTSIRKILAINSLKSKRIFPRQKLKVPSKG